MSDNPIIVIGQDDRIVGTATVTPGPVPELDPEADEETE